MYEREANFGRASQRSYSIGFVAHSDKYRDYLEKALQSKNRTSLMQLPSQQPRGPPPRIQPKFRRIKTLGSGAHSSVYMVKQVYTGAIFALKVISKDIMKKHKELLQQEIKILMKLRHQNIMQLYHIFLDSSGLNLVLQYGEQTLFSYMKRKGRLSQKQSSRIAAQILSALDYLHTSNITHRDIKPQNILLVNGLVKICDFGFAKRGKLFDTQQVMGTMGYLSPEVVLSTHYTNKTDLWAVAVIVYEMTHGRAFVEGATDKEKVIQFTNSRLFVDGSYLLEGFLKRILGREDIRPEACELLRDQFIRGYRE